VPRLGDAHHGEHLGEPPHQSIGVGVNDDEEGLWQDFWELLERLTPTSASTILS